MKHMLLILILSFFVGCATTPSVGSKVWHDERIAEIDRSYDAWEIEEDDYLERKNEADKIRSDYLERRENAYHHYHPYYGFSYGYGHGHYRGGHYLGISHGGHYGHHRRHH